MSADLSGYTFTNGTKVIDWIATLPADERDRAAKVVEAFVAERKPLNMLQVKIRLTARPADSEAGADFIENMPKKAEPKPAASSGSKDVYNSPGPILPTRDYPAPEIAPADKSKSGRLTKLTLTIAAAVILLAIFTKPSREDHLRVMTESVAKATAKALGQDIAIDIDEDMLGGMLGLSQPQFSDEVIESLVSDILDEQLDYHNYILWSTCTATVGYDQETVSIGIFGMVRPTHDDLTIN